MGRSPRARSGRRGIDAPRRVQDGDAVRTTLVAVEDNVPLSVDAYNEVSLVLADLSKEALDSAAGGRDHGPDHRAVHHDNIGGVGYQPRSPLRVLVLDLWAVA
jgi:hypothetical protein